MSVESNPALSASWRGMTSSARAKAAMTSCCLPSMPLACSRRYRETSISIAPPPATTRCMDRTEDLTIMSASWMERSDSSMNCSLPPRRMIVAVLRPVHPLNRLYRSAPICFSSNAAQAPRTSGVRPVTVVWMRAPVARATRSRSSLETRPAQKRPRSAKYCVARSPMGSLERMIWAPLSTHLQQAGVVVVAVGDEGGGRVWGWMWGRQKRCLVVACDGAAAVPARIMTAMTMTTTHALSLS